MEFLRGEQKRGVGGRLTVVQLARFGDLIQTSPLLQNLRSEVTELTLVVDRRVVPVAQMLAGVDRVVGVDLSKPPVPDMGVSLTHNLRVIKKWADPWKDAAVADKVLLLNQGDLPSYIAKSITADQYAGPFKRDQLPAPHLYLNNALVNRRFNPLHLVEIWGGYASRSLTLPAPALRPDVGIRFAKHSDKRTRNPELNGVYAVNVGAGAAGRRLRAEKLAELTLHLLEMGANRVDLLGSPDERPVAWKVLEALPPGDRRVRNLVGQTSLELLPSVLGQADVLISSDTGTLQLAAATGTRPLGIFFGGANPVETGPYCEGAVALVHRHSLSQKEDDPAGYADELQMEQVAALATKMSDTENEVATVDDQFNAFDLLVARPSSLGVRYGNVSREKRLQFGAGERWLPLLESLIHADAGTSGEPNEANRTGVGGARSASALLSEIRDGASAYWMSIEEDEKQWISTIVKAFEESGYLGLAGGKLPKLEKSYDA